MHEFCFMIGLQDSLSFTLLSVDLLSYYHHQFCVKVELWFPLSFSIRKVTNMSSREGEIQMRMKTF